MHPKRRELQIRILVLDILELKLLSNIDFLLLVVHGKHLLKIFEAFFAVLIKIFHKLLFLHDLRHVLTQSQLGSGVLSKPIVALNDVL